MYHNHNFNDNFFFRESIERSTEENHMVRVLFEGRELPGIFARIGKYQGGNLWVVAPLSNPTVMLVNDQATNFLRAAGYILPMESVGNPLCTRDSCILQTRYSNMEAFLESRRHVLAAIPAAGAAMKKKCRDLRLERSGLSVWSKKRAMPQEIEYLLHQFVGPVPTWRTWISAA